MSRSKFKDTKYGTEGIMYGNAKHNNFGAWELDLHFEAPDRLLVLDTPPDEDALYYGTAFIRGRADITGPIDELVIDVAATTEKGTTFKIPISETESISDDSFVYFLSPKEKQARIEGETVVTESIKGLSLNFDLDINNNAEVEVVVDKVNNSTLKGRGAGILLIEINTNGKFQMYGDFQVYKGEYDFRYGGIIQKNISVVPGGNITWNGAPEKANLNLSAVYRTAANPSVLLDNPAINTKIPVEVYVDLLGQLAHPELKFNIDFPRVSSTLKSELQYKLQNEEQKQQQALFLLASGSFVSDNYAGTNAFAGTVADRVSGLVNDLFADEDGKFRVGLDYSVGTRTPDQETADRIGLTLSTEISERVLINGKVGVPVGGANESAVAGDIEVQWLINEDGSLRMKFFNRQADLQFIGEDQIFEQGTGISYSVDFNTFRELYQKLFNKKMQLESEVKNEEDEKEDNNSETIKPQATKVEEED
nr:translocation/assembly module TamB domain-containing protein [Aequorivita xiaoshiensis]